MSAKSQVKHHITLIQLVLRRTYDTTLAELTSLEEMLRIMMDEGLVHTDVIAKLWQVYSELSTISH